MPPADAPNAAPREEEQPALEAAAAKYRAGRFDACAAILHDLLARDPENAQAHNLLGFARQAQDDCDAAIACFRRAVALRPDAPGAHNNLAAALARAGKLADAVAAYDDAIRLAPSAAAIRYNKALTLAALGRMRAAIAAFDETLARDPAYGDADLRLASILARSEATAPLPFLETALLCCFASPRVDYVALARPAARQLRLKYGLDRRCGF